MTPPKIEPVEDVFLTSADIRRRYGNVSDMWIHRRLTDGSGFPAPMVGPDRRRRWKLSECLNWERKQPVAKQTGKTGNTRAAQRTR
jgi:hypothetical protein